MNRKNTSKKTFSILVGLLLVFEALFAPASFAQDTQGSVMLAFYDKNGRMLETVTASHNLNQELTLHNASQCRVFYFDENNKPVNDEGSAITFVDGSDAPLQCTHGLHVKVTKLPEEWVKGSLDYWCSECGINKTGCEITCNLFTTGVMAVVNTHTMKEYGNATPGMINYSIQNDKFGKQYAPLGSVGNIEESNAFSNENASEGAYKVDVQKWRMTEEEIQLFAETLENGDSRIKPLGDADPNVRVIENYYAEGDDPENITLKLMASGTHCTVWGTQDDDIRIQLTTAKANEIAAEFDSKYTVLTSNFGELYDSDGDGKLAIYCYDICSDFKTFNPSQPGFSGGYTGGFFYGADLIGQGCEMHDCIHIDTYPSMVSFHSNTAKFSQASSAGLFLDEVSESYSTLIHEGQHLINFSKTCYDNFKHGEDFYQMDTFINEAMSMAAEHMICGSDSTSSRIDYFNDPEYYHPGTSLTVWEGDGITGDTSQLSNYSNSYLFGQYLRTRYDQINHGNGGTVFKQIIESNDQDYYLADDEYDSLAVAAQLLGYSDPSAAGKEQLVKDFWTAVYKKEDTGKYGFNGEEWADAINPIVFGEIVSYEAWCEWREQYFQYLSENNFDYINNIFGGEFGDVNEMTTFFFTLDSAIYDGGCIYFKFDDNEKTPKEYKSSSANVELLRFPDEN